MAQPAAERIFISYRREDTPHVAGRLADRIAAKFGAAQVFMDVDSIDPGVDFAEAITNAVGSCDVLLALIGWRWADIRDERDRRRLEDIDDFVVLEIQAALSRGIRLIPVLVDGAAMPTRDQLPTALQPVVRRNALRLRHETFRDDAGRLLQALEKLLSASRPEARSESRSGATRPEMDRTVQSGNQQMLRVGQRFEGKVIKTTGFGAFVSITPDKDGLVHISKLGRDGERVTNVEDVVAIGDTVHVMITDIDSRGKISLSRVWGDSGV